MNAVVCELVEIVKNRLVKVSILQANILCSSVSFIDSKKDDGISHDRSNPRLSRDCTPSDDKAGGALVKCGDVSRRVHWCFESNK